MKAATSYLKDLDYSVVQQCMHCGMCLPTCPTYDATKLERNSPRGRIALMRAIARDERTTLILNVRNRRTLSVLDAEAVIEVPCLVDANGAHPVSVDPNDTAERSFRTGAR